MMSAKQVHEAVCRGDLDAVRKMVKANPSLKKEPYRDWTLKCAAYHGQAHIARYLVGETGVDEDKVNCNGWTSLYWAACLRQVHIARYLVEEAGVDKDKVNCNGWTPLMVAALCGCLKVVRYLLEVGVDAKLKNKDGETALAIAKKEGYAEVAALLREYLPGGLMFHRRDAVQTSVLNQKDLGPDVAQFCGEFVKLT